MRSRRKPQQELISAEVELSVQKAKDMAQAIVSARKAAGMTQRQVAEAMQTTQSTIADMERGRSLPSTRTLQKFAEATNHTIQIRFVQRPAQTVSQNERRTMTDTLSRPGHSIDRRHFLGGAMGMAGLLGFGHIRHITAQEATAAAEAVDSYVWTPPEWGEERVIFKVIDRRENTVVVETLDGEIEVPTNPQRMITLDDEYAALFELGYTDTIIAVGGFGGENLINLGDLTGDLHETLGDLPVLHPTWELELEPVIALDPDLILGNANYQGDETYPALSETAPFLRKTFRVIDSPRATVRDLGELFDLEDKATGLLTEHEAYIERARQALGTEFTDKKVGLITYYQSTGEFLAMAPYYLSNGEIGTMFHAYPFYRELNLTPPGFIESLSVQDDRASFQFGISLEHYGQIDADIVFVYAVGGEEQMQEFLDNPIVQTTPAYKANTIYAYDRVEHGYSLAGVRSSVKYIVETLTGEPFE